MYTGAVTPELLQRSVIAVPPLCCDREYRPARSENEKLVRHLESGGVTTLLYGGNANFYNLGSTELPAVLDQLEDLAGADSWLIPSCGPDFGKLMDQAPILRARSFPTAMVLPLTFPATPEGVETGIRRFADAAGLPVIVYVKAEGYLEPRQVAKLVEDGVAAAVKYAIVRKDPGADSYLSELCQEMDTSRIVSGIGERPVIEHFQRFGIRAFTSGSVSIAPRASDRIRRLLLKGESAAAEELRKAFLPFEDLRDAISPLRVLHSAVTVAGIADTGPARPMLSPLGDEDATRVAQAAVTLRAFDSRLA
jgi:dihydrodipicolinate synthase/N-acetylneuraminate lyase